MVTTRIRPKKSNTNTIMIFKSRMKKNSTFIVAKNHGPSSLNKLRVNAPFSSFYFQTFVLVSYSLNSLFISPSHTHISTDTHSHSSPLTNYLSHTHSHTLTHTHTHSHSLTHTHTHSKKKK